MKKGGFLKIFTLLFLVFSCFVQAQWQALNYKPLPSTDITLNFVRAINPRFPKLDEKYISIYLSQARNVVKEHFGLNLTFKRQRDITVKSLFEVFSQKVRQELNKNICNFKKSNIDKARLVADLHQTLKSYESKMNLNQMLSFARPHLVSKKDINTSHDLAVALIDTELYRLKQWLKIKAKDGKSVINENDFNEWSYWDSLGYFHSQYDVVLTNQLIASAEYYGQDMHSALRGGIVAGTTSYKKDSSFDALVFMTSFLFINDNKMVKKLRGNKNYTKEEAARYAGAYLAHEIGHMLLRLGHPFGNKHCVMSPSKMLYFDQWYQEINAKKCSLGSNPSMTPGSVTLYYDDVLID